MAFLTSNQLPAALLDPVGARNGIGRGGLLVCGARQTFVVASE
jgi:hypothetical protein